MNKINSKPGLLICLLLIISSSCVTFEQRVLVQPIIEDFPVSASSSIYWNGQVYGSDTYTIVGEFEYTAILESPIPGGDALELDINDDLAEIMNNSEADGIVHYSFQLLDIQKSSLALMDISQTIIGMGLVTIGSGIYFQIADNVDMQAVYLGGAGAAALGLGGYLYTKATGSITYVYAVSGTLVTLK